MMNTQNHNNFLDLLYSNYLYAILLENLTPVLPYNSTYCNSRLGLGPNLLIYLIHCFFFQVLNSNIGWRMLDVVCKHVWKGVEMMDVSQCEGIYTFNLITTKCLHDLWIKYIIIYQICKFWSHLIAMD